MRPPSAEIPPWALVTLNNVYDVERKIIAHGDPANVRRNLERIKDAFLSLNLFYEDPMGLSFSETRSDMEASIAGAATDDLVVVEVIKPIIRYGNREHTRVVQKGIVVVRSKGAGDI